MIYIQGIYLISDLTCESALLGDLLHNSKFILYLPKKVVLCVIFDYSGPYTCSSATADFYQSGVKKASNIAGVKQLDGNIIFFIFGDDFRKMVRTSKTGGFHNMGRLRKDNLQWENAKSWYKPPHENYSVRNFKAPRGNHFLEIFKFYITF